MSDKPYSVTCLPESFIAQGLCAAQARAFSSLKLYINTMYSKSNRHRLHEQYQTELEIGERLQQLRKINNDLRNELEDLEEHLTEVKEERNSYMLSLGSLKAQIQMFAREHPTDLNIQRFYQYHVLQSV